MSNVTVAERTIAPGIAVNSGMTGQQIFEAHLRAAGEKPSQQPHVSFSGPQGHPHTVVPGESAAVRNPPPSPAALEQQNKPAPPQGAPSATRQAEVDAEQQRAGLQVRPDGRTLAAGAIDHEAIALLQEHYKALAAPLLNSKDPAQQAAAERFKQAFENDLRSLLDGKQLTQRQLDTLKKSLGKVDTFVPKTRETATAPAAEPTAEALDAALTAAAKASTKDGYAPASAIGPELRYGYSLPEGREYNVAELVAGLRLARQGDLSQQQINRILKGM